MAVSAAATIPPVHDSAVAPVHLRDREQVEDDLGQRPLVGREHVLPELGPHRCGERLARRCSCPRIGPDVDLDLEAARADRRLDAGRVASGRPVRCRRHATRRCRTCACSQRARGRARANTSASAGWPGASSHSRRSSDGTPGRTTTTDPSTGRTRPGAVPAMPEHGRSGGHMCLLAVPGVEAGPVEPVADGDLVGPAVDPLEHARVEHQIDAGDVRERLDGAVVVGRARARPT